MVTRRAIRVSILPVNIAILAIGIVDLATTLFYVQAGLAGEANPIMAALLDVGVLPFAAVKLFTLCAYVALTEWYSRARSATFARTVGNITVLAYLGIYAASFTFVNSHFFL